MNEISLWKEYSFLIISCSYNMSFFSENCVSYKKDPQFSSGIMGTRQPVPSSSIGTGILCCDSVPAGMKKISARLPFSFILICNFLKGRQIPIRKLFKEYFWKRILLITTKLPGSLGASFCHFFNFFFFPAAIASRPKRITAMSGYGTGTSADVGTVPFFVLI